MPGRKSNRPQRSSVRIIGGQQGGQRLHFVDKGGDLRPTGDRLRETLFNWLQFELGGRRVLDLFAGSGALAAEALSRGATDAVVIERKKARCADLSRQLKPLFGGRVFVRCADALEWLQRTEPQAFGLVFVDPPYDLQLQEKACELLEALGWLSADALVYVESSNHEPAPAVPGNWVLSREQARGDVRAMLYRREPGWKRTATNGND